MAISSVAILDNNNRCTITVGYTASAEVVSLVRERYQELRRRHGYTDPHILAHTLIGGRESPYYQETIHTLLRTPTAAYLYPGAREILQTLFDRGDTIHLWTQGNGSNQFWKIAESGLSRIRQSQPPAERARFAVFAERDKLTPVPELLTAAVEKGAGQVVFVDDKAANLHAVAEKVQAGKQTGRIPASVEPHLVQMQHTGKTNGEQSLFPAQPLFATVTSVADLLALRESLAPGSPVYWFIDLGDTLLDTEKLQQATYERLAEIVERLPTILSPLIDLDLGLHGRVVSVQRLPTGSAKREAALLTYTNKQKEVVKHSNSERIMRESQGYDLLAATPLGRHMPYPHFVDVQAGIILLPFVSGIPLREGALAETIPEGIALPAYHDLLTLKRNWWSHQGKRRHGYEAISVQRYDWPDTQEKLAVALAPIASQLQVTLDELLDLPIVTAQGETNQSIRRMVETVGRLLEHHPRYTVLTHGDVTGANLLVDPVTGEWHAIDPEFAGFGDPAESLVKIVKYETTATAQRVQNSDARILSGELLLTAEVQFSPLARALHAEGLARVGEFGTALHDPDFAERFRADLAGSYLRGAALTVRRNRPDLLIFELKKAAEILSPLNKS